MESRPPPNLSDPAELAAYRKELREVVRGLRYGSVGVTLAGAAVALARAKVWPAIPVLVPVVVIALGVMLMITAMAFRAAYHARRMRGD
jgi:heme/copper-type cytochrome/quinol oxidase subunit 2